MAAGGSDTGASIRHAGSTAHERGRADPARGGFRGGGDGGNPRSSLRREGWRSRLSGGARARRDRGAHAGGPERRAGRARPGAGAADSNPGLRRKRRWEDDGSGEARRPARARASVGAVRRGRHVSRRRRRAAAGLGGPARRAVHHWDERSRGGGVRRDRGGARPGGRHRHGARGYRRAAAHGRAPARGVEESGARRRQAAAGRAARVVPGARRHGGTERGAPGPRLRGRGAAHRADRDEARRHREGRERGGARARGASPDPLSRHGRGPRRSRGVRRGTVRAEAHRRVTLQLRTSVKYLKGVGPKRAEALARLGIRSVGDLLYHAPRRYLDATTVTPLHKVQVGQEATCVGRVVSTGVLPTRKGLRVFRAVLRDDSGGGPLECAWPGQPFLERQIKKGQLLLVTGPVRYYHGRQLVPREFVILADEGEPGPERGLVLPVYPATEGLTHRQIRGLIHQHLDALLALVADPHPKSLRAAVGLPELGAALAAVHRPATPADAEAGRRRLAFDELFDQQLVQARARALAKRARAGISFALKKALTTKLKTHLPFELTGDQRQAIREITDDMLAPLRMHRLLMGDVGTGKTVVALFAMLLAVENDYQAAIMAPTELLAEQHLATLTRLLEPLALYGDLDVTQLRERPPGRGTVKTALRTEAARQKIYDFIRAECVAGRQAYVIYPVIDESERADLKAATVMAERLAKVFPELEVGLVHGRLKAEERDATMRAFRDNAVHVLVATSVIEVGIDVANATVMLIEHAERFGLAQLHQLRGRVGRGAAASHCILLSDIPDAAPRLQAFAETSDGFKIAELDLQERGMGELAGARQSGGVPLRYANFATDLPLLEAARHVGQENAVA